MKPRVVMEIGSREAIREAVIMGVGIAAVSEIEYIPDPEIRMVTVSDARCTPTPTSSAWRSGAKRGL